MSADKAELAGINSKDSSRTFYAKKLGASETSKTEVTMSSDGKIYNLLTDPVSFVQNSGDLATISVVPDWQGHTPGTVRLFQMGIAVESKTGAFVDMVPSKLFSPLESIYYALIDSASNVVETRKLKLRIEVDTATRLEPQIQEIALRVYENKKDSGSQSDKYVLSKGATVSAAGKTYTTDEDGYAEIPSLDTGSITVSKAGFADSTLTAEQLEVTKDVYLQKAGDGKPVVTAVWAENVNILNKELAIGLLSDQKLTFTAQVNWGSSSYGSIQLVQDARSVKFTKDSLTMVLSDKFDVSKPVYIQATDAAGKSTKKELKFSPGEVSAIPSYLKGAKFSTGDSFSVTLPSNMNPSFLAGKEISADISSMIPVTLSVEDGKVYVAIGLDLASYEYKDKWATSSATGNRAHVLSRETQTFIDKFKESGVMDTGDAAKSMKKLKNLAQTYRTAMKYPQGSFGVEADFTVLGFVEGYVNDSGSVTWLDGGVILNPSVSVSYNLGFTLGPVPMYFEAGFGANILGQLNVLFNQTAKQFTPNGSISGTISLNGGIGVGMKKVLYAGGGLEGKLKPDWHIYLSKQDSFKLTASLNAYAKIGVAFFEYKKDWDPIAEAVWVDLPKHKTALTTPGSGVYDSGSYQRKNLSYLDGGSQFTANQITVPLLMTQRANAAYLTSTTIQTNLYRESTPQYVRFADGTALALWLDAQSSNVNEIQLYYAYHNGSAWSAPAPVQADGTMDYTPQLKLIGNTAYLVWQNATLTFSDGDTLDSIAPYFDISVAQFDPASGFTVSNLTKEGLDMIPTLCGDGTKTYAVWVNNSQNAWFGGNQANHILYSENTGTGWSEPVSAYTDLKAIDSLAADYSEGTLRIAYCMDTDGNVSTAEDVRLFENGTRASDAGSAEANPQYLDHMLYWYRDSKLCSADGDVQETEGLNGSYQILSSEAGSAVVYASANGLASTLNASFYNSDTMRWCEPFALTDGTEFIGAFSAAMDDDGSIRVLCNAQKVTGTYADEDPYGEAALKLIASAPYCDLTMGELSYSLDQYSAGNAMELSFPLTNNGSLVVNSILVTVTDGSGSTLSSLTLDDVIVPGQTRDLSTYFNVPENAVGQNVTVTVMPNGLTDIRTADNAQSAALQFEDVGIQRTTLGFRADETPVVTADIVNYGYHSQSNITAELRKDTADGALIESKTIASLEPLALESISFALTGQSEGVCYVVLKDNADSFAANDTDFVAWGAAEAEEDEEENQASVVRIAGKDRHETAFKIADMLKTQLDVEKFDTMIIASGSDSADALAGSYLAARKGAPILLSRGSSHARNLEYIQNNLAPGGKVYILGGTAAVPEEMENLLKDNNIQYERLKGKTRFDTNLAILDEAGMEGNEILVSTGYNFADSLSASASGKPILLVHTKADALTDSQKTWLSTQRGKTFTIIGGTGAVSEALETALKAYGTTTRLKGSGREATSVEVAKKFFTAPDAVLLAYSRNFPDGLCGGPLAYAMKAPLLLVNVKQEAVATDYVNQNSIQTGYILGGTSVVSDDTARTVFDLDSSTEIPKQ